MNAECDDLGAFAKEFFETFLTDAIEGTGALYSGIIGACAVMIEYELKDLVWGFDRHANRDSKKLFERDIVRRDGALISVGGISGDARLTCNPGTCKCLNGNFPYAARCA